jgi:uncharacterized repeat protein (TIGR01451 family)
MPRFARRTTVFWGAAPAVAVYRDQLYIFTQSVWRKIDGSRGMFAYRWDGTAFHPVASLNALPAFVIEHEGKLYTGGAFTRSCSMMLDHIARLCDSSECGGVTGRLVDDPSGDCENLGVKPGIAQNIIEVMPGPRYLVTDSGGNYRFMAEPGTYTLRAVLPRYYQQTCPRTGAQTAVSTTAGETIRGINFAHAPIPNIHDIAISMAATRPRAGTVMRVTLTCVNNGTIDRDHCHVRLAIDPQLQFDRAEPAEAMKSAAAIEWDLTNIARGERRTIDAYFLVPRSMPANTVICLAADADGSRIGDDICPSDNFDSLCVRVLNSYDPNDIAVTPGSGERGLLSVGDSIVTYTIRFENTGNDTAYRIVVIDTLDPNLDVTSISLGVASHPSKLAFGDAGALIWIFDQIMLPADSLNPSASQGYLKFSVALNHGLKPGTEITNRASIYFDYNIPVLTNTALTTTAPPASVRTDDAASVNDVAIYPNPANDLLHIRGALREGSLVSVENLLGEVMHAAHVERSGELSIDVSGLAAGAYIIRIETPHGAITRMVTLVR